MRHFLLLTVTAALLLSSLPASAEGDQQAILIQKSVPFDNESRIRTAIKTDCDLEAKLAEYLKDYAEENGISVVAVDQFPIGDTRPQLEMVIVDAIGGGGGMWSGPKSIFIEGKYRENGKVKATFSGHRSSSGGFMGGYKGTCSILGRCVKALGKDVAEWLRNPSSSTKLGE